MFMLRKCALYPIFYVHILVRRGWDFQTSTSAPAGQMIDYTKVGEPKYYVAGMTL